MGRVRWEEVRILAKTVKNIIKTVKCETSEKMGANGQNGFE